MEEENSRIEVLDFLEDKHLDEFLRKELAYWTQQKDLVDYFTQCEVPLMTEVETLSPEVIQSVFECVQRALEEYDMNNFSSEKWGQILESFTLWENVSRRIRLYCETMGNLGMSSKELVSSEAKTSIGDSVPSEFLSKFLSEEEYCSCECCGLETPRNLFSCSGCGSPLR